MGIPTVLVPVLYSPDHRTCGTGTVVVRARRGASMLGDDASYIAQVLIGIALRPNSPPTLTRSLGPSLI